MTQAVLMLESQLLTVKKSVANRISIILAILLLCGSAQAQPQPRCTSRHGMLEFLESKYGEVHRAIGQLGPDIAIELLLGPDGSFTIIRSQADGEMSCMIASGTNWTDTAERPLPGQKT